MLHVQCVAAFKYSFILQSLLYLTQIVLPCILYATDVNIAEMQMLAIFSLDSKVWLMNYAVWLNKCLL